jgi:hypothetical protein
MMNILTGCGGSLSTVCGTRRGDFIGNGRHRRHEPISCSIHSSLLIGTANAKRILLRKLY